jgi:hypothetical protein
MRSSLLFVALLTSSTVYAQAKPVARPAGPSPAQIEAMEKAQAPGPIHQWLKSRLAGSWTMQIKVYTGPGEPQLATGTAEVKAIHGDRFLAEEFTTNIMGKPMTGTVTFGYDNMRKRVTSNEIDSRGTTMTMLSGTLDEATHTVTLTGPIWSMVANREVAGRLVLRAESDKKHTIELYSTGADGKEQKRMEQVYTRTP